jgi:hypothetical protein
MAISWQNNCQSMASIPLVNGIFLNGAAAQDSGRMAESKFGNNSVKSLLADYEILVTKTLPRLPGFLNEGEVQSPIQSPISGLIV